MSSISTANCLAPATGSSTLGASSRFRDTLAGRKEEVWLTPMTLADVAAAGGTLDQRLARGGLPQFFAAPCEVSRTTVANYLAVLEATFVMHVVRPFSGKSAREIVSAPKVYGFDTGFVRAFRGWRTLRDEDRGHLWEHVVLNELHAHSQRRQVMYWRSKQKQEIDFVLPGRGRAPIAIECKWRSDDYSADNLQAFRRLHVEGRNYVVASDVQAPFERRHDSVTVRYVDLPTLVAEVVAR